MNKIILTILLVFFCNTLFADIFKKIEVKGNNRIDKNVIMIAIVIPIIPRRLPCLDVSGDERPLNARMNNIPEIK